MVFNHGTGEILVKSIVERREDRGVRRLLKLVDRQGVCGWKLKNATRLGMKSYKIPFSKNRIDSVFVEVGFRITH